MRSKDEVRKKRFGVLIFPCSENKINMKLPVIGQDPEPFFRGDLPDWDFWRWNDAVIGGAGKRRKVLSPALPLLKRKLWGKITLNAL